MRFDDLLRIICHFQKALTRFVIRVLRPVRNRDPVPAFIACGKGITLLERRRFEGSSAELCPGKTA